ncbi:hypothetical protein CDD82_799 [Ophiocordyceps australis]|uniref:Casein kinase II beta 2 subunit n=1 Tax=Ophiocordyceps australis TaxID=1399860 RepID=A0A2C5YKL1_9HYPO|nr:hypothetical protein CDD82_799 [Ophiocordyceps australis]
MASVEAIWGPATLRLLRAAASKAAKAVRFKLRNAPRHSHAPSGRLATRLSRQQQNWFSGTAIQHINNTLCRFIGSGRNTHSFHGSRLATSSTARRIATCGRAPFASTLRPNLTGGAMPRSAGGYSLGGSARRHFSHAPTAPAQVVQNVSQAMRAFFVSGNRIKYDGSGPRGQPTYRAMSKVEHQTMRKMANATPFAPGSFIDFKLNPTITALSPLTATMTDSCDASEVGSGSEALCNLNTRGFFDVLSADFGRAVRDLTAVYDDLRRLSVLGDLSIFLEGDCLRVRFPGVDASLVSRLCDDVGIQRGIVGQDLNYDSSAAVCMALRFPFASDAEQTIRIPEDSSPQDSSHSLDGHELDSSSSLECDSFVQDAFQAISEQHQWSWDLEGYESMSTHQSSGANRSYEGLEGIYRFLEECDRGKGRLG